MCCVFGFRARVAMTSKGRGSLRLRWLCFGPKRQWSLKTIAAQAYFKQGCHRKFLVRLFLVFYWSRPCTSQLVGSSFQAVKVM